MKLKGIIESVTATSVSGWIKSHKDHNKKYK